MSRRILENNTDRGEGESRAWVISMFLSWLPGLTLNRKWEVLQQRRQVVA